MTNREKRDVRTLRGSYDRRAQTNNQGEKTPGNCEMRGHGAAGFVTDYGRVPEPEKLRNGKAICDSRFRSNFLFIYGLSPYAKNGKTPGNERSRSVIRPVRLRTS